MSEIDDIFAGKAKGKASVSAPKIAPSSSNLSNKKDKKKKKKKKEDVSDAVPNDLASHDASPVASSSSKKRPAPETVLDTSHHLSGPLKRHKGDQPKPSEEAKASKSRSKKAVDADAAFKDSRGTSDRRKTEEGWLVYKEDELGIGDEGGGEPLCVHYFLLFTATRVQTHPYVHLIATVVFELPLQYTFFFRQSSSLFSSSSLHGSFEASPIAPYIWKRSICSQHQPFLSHKPSNSSVIWRYIANALAGIHFCPKICLYLQD
ncbi:hypothetical protein BJ912DRAFT_207403 [Pholiota molesta]|nr:hypothetical protein BJ912DRAFT_207403 [Pholiota molesta]